MYFIYNHCQNRIGIDTNCKTAFRETTQGNNILLYNIIRGNILVIGRSIMIFDIRWKKNDYYLFLIEY